MRVRGFQALYGAHANAETLILLQPCYRILRHRGTPNIPITQNHAQTLRICAFAVPAMGVESFEPSERAVAHAAVGLRGTWSYTCARTRHDQPPWSIKMHVLYLKRTKVVVSRQPNQKPGKIWNPTKPLHRKTQITTSIDTCSKRWLSALNSRLNVRFAFACGFCTSESVRAIELPLNSDKSDLSLLSDIPLLS